MTDITRCLGESNINGVCEKRETCRRFIRKDYADNHTKLTNNLVSYKLCESSSYSYYMEFGQ